jgi:hypothetical protein
MLKKKLKIERVEYNLNPHLVEIQLLIGHFIVTGELGGHALLAEQLVLFKTLLQTCQMQCHCFLTADASPVAGPDVRL